jgi:hypothetical protein
VRVDPTDRAHRIVTKCARRVSTLRVYTIFMPGNYLRCVAQVILLLHHHLSFSFSFSEVSLDCNRKVESNGGAISSVDVVVQKRDVGTSEPEILALCSDTDAVDGDDNDDVHEIKRVVKSVATLSVPGAVKKRPGVLRNRKRARPARPPTETDISSSADVGGGGGTQLSEANILHVLTSRQASVSPREASASPREASVSPREASVSPREVGASSRETSASSSLFPDLPHSYTDSHIPSLSPCIVTSSVFLPDRTADRSCATSVETSIPPLEPFSFVQIASQRMISTQSPPLHLQRPPSAVTTSPPLLHATPPPSSSRVDPLPRLCIPIARRISTSVQPADCTYDDLDLDILVRMPYLANTLLVLTS